MGAAAARACSGVCVCAPTAATRLEARRRVRRGEPEPRWGGSQAVGAVPDTVWRLRGRFRLAWGRDMAKIQRWCGVCSGVARRHWGWPSASADHSVVRSQCRSCTGGTLDTRPIADRAHRRHGGERQMDAMPARWGVGWGCCCTNQGHPSCYRHVQYDVTPRVTWSRILWPKCDITRVARNHI